MYDGRYYGHESTRFAMEISELRAYGYGGLQERESASSLNFISNISKKVYLNVVIPLFFGGLGIQCLPSSVSFHVKVQKFSERTLHTHAHTVNKQWQ